MIKYLKDIYYGAFVWFNIVEFDTQDNLVRSTGDGWNWKQNMDLDNWVNLQNFGLRRISMNRLHFVSKTKIKAIRLDQFKYPHKIKRQKDGSFFIDCKKMQEYFDDTDNVRVLVREK